MQDRGVQLASLCLLDTGTHRVGQLSTSSFGASTGPFVYLTLTALPKH